MRFQEGQLLDCLRAPYHSALVLQAFDDGRTALVQTFEGGRFAGKPELQAAFQFSRFWQVRQANDNYPPQLPN